MRFYRLYGADGNRMALPASWDSFGNGILMMLKGSSEYKRLKNLTTSVANFLIFLPEG